MGTFIIYIKKLKTLPDIVLLIQLSVCYNVSDDVAVMNPLHVVSVVHTDYLVRIVQCPGAGCYLLSVDVWDIFGSYNSASVGPVCTV